MILINELEFTRIDTDTVLLLNLINGAADFVCNDTFENLVNNRLDKLTEDDIAVLVDRRHAFIDKDAYKRFVSDLNLHIDSCERNSTPNFVLIPTYACNLNCSYCFESSYSIDNKGAFFDIADVMVQFEIIDYIVDKGTFSLVDGERINVTIMGGEPLLDKNYDNIKVILEQSKKRNFSVDIISNGVNVHNFIPLFLAFKDTIDHIQITLDGTQKTHDSRRMFHDKSGSFDIIIKNLSLLVDIGVATFVRVNVDSQNIKNLVELAGVLDAKFGSCECLKPYIYLLQDGGCSGEVNIVKEEDGIEKIFKLENSNPCLKIFSKRYHPSHFIGSVINDMPYQPMLRHCGASKNQYILDNKYNIYKCWHGIGNDDYRVGTYENGIFYIDEFKLNSWFKRNTVLLEMCSECKYRYICGTGCPAARHIANESFEVDKPNCVEYEKLIKVIIENSEYFTKLL